MSISLSLKTTIKHGLILYNGGNNGDYIALELIEGRFYYVYSLDNQNQVWYYTAMFACRFLTRNCKINLYST